MAKQWKFYERSHRGTKWVAFDMAADVPVFFPRKPCCYVVYIDGILQYVGQTHDMKLRMSAHGVRVMWSDTYQTAWGECKNLVIKAKFGTKWGDWLMREARLINRLNPALNRVGKKNATACV